MSEETKAPASSTIETLSIASIGPLHALVSRKTTTQPTGEKASELFVSIRRTPLKPTDDAGLIPLIEIPALAMLLKSIAEPAMAVRSLVAPTPPAAPAAPSGTFTGPKDVQKFAQEFRAKKASKKPAKSGKRR